MKLNIISPAQRYFLTALAAFNTFACLKDSSSFVWHLYNFQGNLQFHWNIHHSYCGLILTLAHGGEWPMITEGFHLLLSGLKLSCYSFPLTFTLFHFLCVLRKQILFLNSLIQDETSVELQSVRKFRQMNKCMKAPKTELLVCQDTSCD